MGIKFKDKILVGITGGIGSGKSEVCRILAKKGYKVIFADLMAKDLYKTNKTLARKVIKAFGKAMLNSARWCSLTRRTSKR
ncbi:MAG: dephospho-CoA kinase [Bacteroidetes bacterium]|nr:dephospho-CoA kinase [Bacteroidota bacterium]